MKTESNGPIRPESRSQQMAEQESKPSSASCLSPHCLLTEELCHGTRGCFPCRVTTSNTPSAKIIWPQVPSRSSTPGLGSRKPGSPPRFCLAADSRQEPGLAVVQASVTAQVIRNLQPYLHNPHNPMQILLPFVILIKWWKASQAPTCSALSPSGATLTLCPFQDSSWAWCRIRIHKSKFDLLHSQLPKASLAPEITR